MMMIKEEPSRHVTWLMTKVMVMMTMMVMVVMMMVMIMENAGDAMWREGCADETSK